MTFQRYAIYYAPPQGAEWSRFATAWLGWDMETGQPVAHPDLDLPVPVAQITATPRKYGLHGTIKPPFRLAPGTTVADLQQALQARCAAMPGIALAGLELSRLGRFLALRPVGNASALAQLAAGCVRDLDVFRAPASAAELARRRAKGLSPAQEDNLTRWGYPYVMDQFRFHITLTGRLDPEVLTPVTRALDTALSPLLPAPFLIPDLALVGEDADGRFHLIHRYTLSG